jgi:hypothetical protein
MKMTRGRKQSKHCNTSLPYPQWCDKCKAASREYQREYHRTPKAREYRREYKRTPKAREYQREYHRTPKAREYQREYRRKITEKNKETRALNLLNSLPPETQVRIISRLGV